MFLRVRCVANGALNERLLATKLINDKVSRLWTSHTFVLARGAEPRIIFQAVLCETVQFISLSMIMITRTLLIVN